MKLVPSCLWLVFRFTAGTLNLHFRRVEFDFLSEAPEARQIVAHGETVGQRPQTNLVPAGASDKIVRSFSAAPAGA